MHGEVPGARTHELGVRLRACESRGVTYLSDDFPVFWESASGANVFDVDGNAFIDLSGAFGVASTGHANPYVASAIADQALRLMHAMGDVHPTEVRVQLMEKLAQLAPGDLSKSYLAVTGSDAIETALKTAILATGKPAVAAFKGGYHGLSLGALEVCGFEQFREPFADALRSRTLFLDFPRPEPVAGEGTAAAVATIRDAIAARNDVGAILIEPIQARGGCVVPPKGFLSALRALCDEFGLLLILDEIYTGFGRTGAMFAAVDEGVVPDILCVGKAMAGGFPISAAIAKPAVMDAWEASRGESLHTSTYLGNPMGCAAALANIGEIERLELVNRARHLGHALGARFDSLARVPPVVECRGRGLMWGIELRDAVLADATVKAALRHGVILIPCGTQGNVLSITPPLTIAERQLYRALDIVEDVLCKHGGT
ncbi:MAG: aspartate aminotransferase family protein [Candidatus Eremiobacteraeota bacterium]|nr:aspartate aminotransferase family protein [Candidatus Eremiobacteraeota bacterium]